MKVKKTKIIIIGLGVIGKKHLEAIDKVANAELVAVVDVNKKVKNYLDDNVSFYNSIDELFNNEKVDGAIVSTPNNSHFKDVLNVIKYDCPVLVEKPITTNSNDTLELINVSKKKNIDILVGHHRRHNPIIKKAFDLINIFHSKYVDVSEFCDRSILSVLKLIENELRNKPIGYKKVISLMSDRLIYEIMRSLIAIQPLFSGVEENYKFFIDQIILGLLSFLQENLDKELSNKVISNHLNISEDYVGQFFKNSIGFSPQDYIEHKRMERAIELLREDENAVKVISNEVGYKDTAYCCRRFKLMFGVQAGKMRKRLGEI